MFISYRDILGMFDGDPGDPYPSRFFSHLKLKGTSLKASESRTAAISTTKNLKTKADHGRPTTAERTEAENWDHSYVSSVSSLEASVKSRHLGASKGPVPPKGTSNCARRICAVPRVMLRKALRSWERRNHENNLERGWGIERAEESVEEGLLNAYISYMHLIWFISGENANNQMDHN